MNIADTIDSARRAFAIAGRGCLVRIGEDDPRYATVTEIAGRLEPHSETTMLLTAVSEAVERYNPRTEAVILLETDSGFQVLILSPSGWQRVGGLQFGQDFTAPVGAQWELRWALARKDEGFAGVLRLGAYTSTPFSFDR